jgi:hypothetical protein
MSVAARSPSGSQRDSRSRALALEEFGELAPLSRLGGQGRVYRPAVAPASLVERNVVVKLYRKPPPPEAAAVLSEMVSWERALPPEQQRWLEYLSAWPVATVVSGPRLVGIAMRDLSDRFSVPFVMPSGKRDNVMLSLEHLLGNDTYLQSRGLPIRLDTAMRAYVAERVSGAIAFLHQHAIVASDIAPSNVLVAFGAGGPSACLIDCDSMVFRGRQALATVETSDWNLPPEFGERPQERSSDAYKLGLLVLRLFARSHDARTVAPHLRHVPVELRDLLHRALDRVATNRPAAGEWQRALAGLLVAGGLSARYPGPPAPVPMPPPAPLPPAVRAIGATRAAVAPGTRGPYPVRSLAGSGGQWGAPAGAAATPAGAAATPAGAAARLAGAARAAARPARPPSASGSGARPTAGLPRRPGPGGRLATPASTRQLLAGRLSSGERLVMAMWLLALAAVIVLLLSRLAASTDGSTPAVSGVGRPLVSQYYYDPRTGQVVNPGQ